MEGGGGPDEMVVPEEALGAASCYKVGSKNIRVVFPVLYLCPGAMEKTSMRMKYRTQRAPYKNTFFLPRGRLESR